MSTEYLKCIVMQSWRDFPALEFFHRRAMARHAKPGLIASGWSHTSITMALPHGGHAPWARPSALPPSIAPGGRALSVPGPPGRPGPLGTAAATSPQTP